MGICSWFKSPEVHETGDYQLIVGPKKGFSPTYFVQKKVRCVKGHKEWFEWQTVEAFHTLAYAKEQFAELSELPLTKTVILEHRRGT